MKELNIKTHWDEVTIDEYYNLAYIMNNEDDSINRELKVIELLSDRTYEELKTLNLPMLKCVFNRLEFLNTEPTGNLKYEFVIDGEKYNPILEIDKLSTGRYMELLKLNSEDNRDLSKMFSLLLSHKKKKYSEIDFDSLSKSLERELTVEDLFGVIYFYCKLYIASYQIVQESMTGEDKIKMMKGNPMMAVKRYMRDVNK